MKKTLAALVLAAATLTGCSDNNQAINAAEKEGWTDVQVTKTRYVTDFTCGEGEKAYYISGINPAGKESDAIVCCGYSTFKGCTIRH